MALTLTKGLVEWQQSPRSGTFKGIHTSPIFKGHAAAFLKAAPSTTACVRGEGHAMPTSGALGASVAPQH